MKASADRLVKIQDEIDMVIRLVTIKNYRPSDAYSAVGLIGSNRKAVRQKLKYIERDYRDRPRLKDLNKKWKWS